VSSTVVHGHAALHRDVASPPPVSASPDTINSSTPVPWLRDALRKASFNSVPLTLPYMVYTDSTKPPKQNSLTFQAGF